MKDKTHIRVFITGASGFVGANLARACVKKGYDVHLLLRPNKHLWRLHDILPQVTVHNGTVLDETYLFKTLHRINPTYIFHLAANGAYPTQNNLEEIIATNIEGTKNLLLASKDIPYTCFVNTGSSSEYGRKNVPMKETDSCHPESYYAFSKLAATHMCQLFARENNKPICTFRLFSVYGPYEEPTRFVPTIMNNLLQHKPILITPGKQRRDFIYIDDVMRAYFAAAVRGQKVKGEVFNIGTGKEYANDEVVSHLFSVTKTKTQIKKGAYPKRTWDMPHWSANITKTRKTLSWKPVNSLDKGLLATYAWYEKEASA